MAKNPATIQSKKPQVAKPTANPKMGQAAPGQSPCPHCHKIFELDRLAKHIELCENSMAIKKRPKFDAGLHRTQGTQLEKYYKKKNPN